MKMKWENSAHVEGYLFSIADDKGRNKLQKAITGPNSKVPNTEYIRGVVNIATDPEGLNVVAVHFGFLKKYTAAGKVNSTYTLLEKLIDADANGTLNSFEVCGTDAITLRIDGDVEVNDFLGRDGEMIAAKRFRGAFAHNLTSEINPDRAATFSTDMLIVNAINREIEDGDDYMQLKGYCFNFRGDLLPVTYNVRTPEGIRYFEDKEISPSNPFLTKVWGNMTTSVQKSVKEIESAFGAQAVETTTQTFHSWDVIGCSKEPMEFDDEATLTVAEFEQKLVERNEHVAAEKQRTLDWQASRNAAPSGFAAAPFDGGVVVGAAPAAAPTAKDDFMF